MTDQAAEDMALLSSDETGLWKMWNLCETTLQYVYIFRQIWLLM